MKRHLPLALTVLAITAAGAAAGAAAAAPAMAPSAPTSSPAPARAQPDPRPSGDFYRHAEWDDDRDDRRRHGRLSPNTAALRAAGFVQITEVDRDDGRVEVEGYDARGRELEAQMDARAQRVLSVRVDREDD